MYYQIRNYIESELLMDTEQSPFATWRPRKPPSQAGNGIWILVGEIKRPLENFLALSFFSFEVVTFSFM